jgi:hypothetical protein
LRSVSSVLEIRIKRISRFDIERQNKEIKGIKSSTKDVQKKLKDIVGFTINYLDDLLKKYGRHYPRRSTIDTFTGVTARKVALSNLTVGYHRETGLLGYQVKSDCDMTVSCSEYDKILLIYRDGSYKAIKIPEKIFVDHNIYWVGKVAGKTIFNLLYREGSKNLTYIKRFKTPKFILDKEYRLFPAHKKSWIQFLQTGEGVRARIDFVPTKRSKINSQRLEFDEHLIKGGAAIGKRLSTRTVKRISELTVKIADHQDDAEVEKKEVSSIALKQEVKETTKVKEVPPAPPEQKSKVAKVKEVSPAVPKQKSKVAKVKEVSPSAPKQKSKVVEKKSLNNEKPSEVKKKNKSQLGLFDLKKNK